MFGFAARVSKSHPRVSQLALFKTSAAKALALAIKASEAASAPAFSSVSHDGVDLRFDELLFERAQLHGA